MYASIDNLKALTGERTLVQLTDRADPPAGEIDQAIVGKALQDASDLIDGYVGVPYALPLTAVPPMLRGLAEDIAHFRLYREAPPEEVRKRYEEAVKTLEKISKGVVKLPGAAAAGDGAAEPAGRPGMVRIVSSDRLFSRDRMRGL